MEAWEPKLEGLVTALNMMAQQLQDTRNILEKLAAAFGLEYSVDIKDWVDREKLEELRSRPRKRSINGS